MLRHSFQQRGLRLRHRTVDLVDQDDVGEDRAGPKLEVALPLIEDRQTGDVRRLQVRSALDARRSRAVDRLGDRPGEHGLRGAGHVLEQHVAPAHQRGEDELDLLSLAVDDGLDVVQEAIRGRRRTLETIGPL